MGNIHNRFHVSDPVNGFIEAHAIFWEALEAAVALARARRGEFFVYDSMARPGAKQTWTINAAGVRSFERRPKKPEAA